jgi:hypothetical protein
MPFTVSEVYGKQSIEEWLAIKLQEFAKAKYGLNVNVELQGEYLQLTGEPQDIDK